MNVSFEGLAVVSTTEVQKVKFYRSQESITQAGKQASRQAGKQANKPARATNQCNNKLSNQPTNQCTNGSYQPAKNINILGKLFSRQSLPS